MISNVVAFEIGVLALIAHVGLTTVLVRLRRDQAPVLFHILSAAVVALALLFGILIFSADGARTFWIVLSILYGGSIAFLFAFSAVHKSISLEVLGVLSETPQRGLKIGVIARDLVLPRFVERIELLIAGGLAQRTADGYVITERGQHTARRLRLLQRFAGVTSSGLYTRKDTR